MDQTQTLTRAELYEKVWTTPMRKLAMEFGLSDVGLAKICKKNGIPLPGLGHWRLVETGHPPKRKPLPTIQQGQIDQIKIFVREPKPYDSVVNEPVESVPDIQVDEDRVIQHPLALRTKKLFQAISKENNGSTSPKQLKAPHLRVSANSLARALRIVDALFCALEKSAYSIAWHQSTDASLAISVYGQSIEPGLYEVFEQKPHVLTEQEIARRKKYQYEHSPKWDYVATGRLRLAIENLPWEMRYVRKSWGDAKRQRVENRLGDFIASLPQMAKAIKLVSEERERETRRRLEQEKRDEEERRNRDEYNQRAEIVAKLAKGWQESETLRQFAAAINKTLANRSVGHKEKQELRVIAEWVSQHAANVDPVSHPKWMVRQFYNPPWKYGL